MDRRPVVRIEQRSTGEDVDLRRWPFTFAPVAQLLRDSLDLAPGVTFLVGENGGSSLRAETMHGFYTAVGPGPHDPNFHEPSHGESFLAVLETRFDSPGFSCLDEPESALSFTGCLALVGALGDLAAGGAQVLCATHSPLLTALPGATILQVDADGYRRTGWDDLEIVAHWRRFLDDPDSYLRHLR